MTPELPLEGTKAAAPSDHDFDLGQEMYRAIAPQVKPEGPEFDGEVIPFTPDSAHKMSS